MDSFSLSSVWVSYFTEIVLTVIYSLCSSEFFLMTITFLWQSLMEYEEHEKRAWSVDFSRTDPSMLVSGSDDCKVFYNIYLKVYLLISVKCVCTFLLISDIFTTNICNVLLNPYCFFFFCLIL
jgi:hypothetical protein